METLPSIADRQDPVIPRVSSRATPTPFFWTRTLVSQVCANVSRGADRIAHIVKTIETGDEVETVAGKVGGRGDFEGDAAVQARFGGGLVGPGDRTFIGCSPLLGCSDSRVPAEIVFDQGLGDLLVIRVAGNIVASSQVGSVELAAARFGTRLPNTGCRRVRR